MITVVTMRAEFWDTLCTATFCCALSISKAGGMPVGSREEALRIVAHGAAVSYYYLLKSCRVLSNLPEYVVWCFSLILENSQSLLTIFLPFLYLFLFFQYSHYVCYTLSICLTVWIILFYIFFFSFYISVLEVTLGISSSLPDYSLAV